MTVSRSRYTRRYEAMKCGMLIAVPIHACAPAPTSTRSVRPLSRSGTKKISDRPPTRRRSIAGVKIEPGRALVGGASEAPGTLVGAATGGVELVMNYGRDRWTAVDQRPESVTPNVVSGRTW